jgi:uncharacterized membrane protein
MLNQSLIILTIFGLSFLPSFEGRYALVFGILSGTPPLICMLTATSAVVILSAILPLVFPKIDNLMVWLLKRERKFEMKIASIYLNQVTRIRSKVKPHIDQYGVPSLIVFVALPLPASGIWTGALIAYLLGMDRLKTFTVLLAGGFISNLIMLTLTVLGFTIPTLKLT